MAKIQVNGEERDYALPLTVIQLMKLESVEQPDMVSVQVNDEFLNRDEYASHQLADGDSVEFLYFMGGGQSHGF